MNTTQADLDLANAEIERLTAELDDLKLLYEAMIEHGEAVEDQLAEKNLLLERTQARLESELDDATRYIFSILPEKRQIHPTTDWLFTPSTELGGDSFGYHDLDERHFALYLIDVCGHGVGAALLTIAVINVLRTGALAQADLRDPPQVLAALNAAFPMEKQNDKFFTIWYGVYDRVTGALRYCSGGHPPAILIRGEQHGAGAPEYLATPGGIAIGVLDGDVDYECQSVAVHPGDRLLVLSDGTFEVNGPDGDQLDVDGLADYAFTSGNSPAGIHEWVRTFNSEGPLPNDFTLLEVRF